MKPKEIFLSHSAMNKEMADLVAGTLNKHGIKTWYSPAQILTAQEWQVEIGKALKRCDWFMVLLSNDSIGSKWVKRELQYALNHSQYDDHIVPVLIEDCDFEELSWVLGIFQMVNMIDNSDEAFGQILNTWGIAFEPNK